MTTLSEHLVSDLNAAKAAIQKLMLWEYGDNTLWAYSACMVTEIDRLLEHERKPLEIDGEPE